MWELRWRFIYLDQKEDRFGCWSKMGEKPNQAAFTSKENLAKALIEGRDRAGNIKTFIEVHANEYVNFEFIASAPMPYCPYGDLKEVKLVPTITGAMITTRENQFAVMTNGKRLKRNLKELLGVKK